MSNETSNVLRLPQVMTRCGLGRSTIYAKIKDGTFPEPIKLGVRAVGWLESVIDGWLRSKSTQS